MRGLAAAAEAWTLGRRLWLRHLVPTITLPTAILPTVILTQIRPCHHTNFKKRKKQNYRQRQWTLGSSLYIRHWHQAQPKPSTIEIFAFPHIWSRSDCNSEGRQQAQTVADKQSRKQKILVTIVTCSFKVEQIHQMYNYRT